MTSITGLDNRGVFIRPSLYVLRRTKMPAVLLELGFITNPSDADLMSNQPELFARGIYNGILEYYGLL
jgi:N-acetylmuramoyl-L-alanine amidase